MPGHAKLSACCAFYVVFAVCEGSEHPQPEGTGAPGERRDGCRSRTERRLAEVHSRCDRETADPKAHSVLDVDDLCPAEVLGGCVSNLRYRRSGTLTTRVAL